MDETKASHAYRCLPLTIANAMGWEILLPAKVTATWNGGTETSDLIVETHDTESELSCRSRVRTLAAGF